MANFNPFQKNNNTNSTFNSTYSSFIGSSDYDDDSDDGNVTICDSDNNKKQNIFNEQEKLDYNTLMKTKISPKPNNKFLYEYEYLSESESHNLNKKLILQKKETLKFVRTKRPQSNIKKGTICEVTTINLLENHNKNHEKIRQHYIAQKYSPYVLPIYDIYRHQKDSKCIHVVTKYIPTRLYDIINYNPKNDHDIPQLNIKQKKILLEQLEKLIDVFHNKLNAVFRTLIPELILVDKIDSDYRIQFNYFEFSKILEPEKTKETETFSIFGWFQNSKIETKNIKPLDLGISTVPEYIDKNTKKIVDKMIPINEKDLKATDMYQFGLILFNLYTASHPYKDKTSNNTLLTKSKAKQILENNYGKDDENYENFSENTKFVIKKLLSIDPNERLTIKQVLEHEFNHDLPRTNTFNSTSLSKSWTEDLVKNYDKCNENHSMNQSLRSYRHFTRSQSFSRMKSRNSSINNTKNQPAVKFTRKLSTIEDNVFINDELEKISIKSDMESD